MKIEEKNVSSFDDSHLIPKELKWWSFFKKDTLNNEQAAKVISLKYDRSIKKRHFWCVKLVFDWFYTKLIRSLPPVIFEQIWELYNKIESILPLFFLFLLWDSPYKTIRPINYHSKYIKIMVYKKGCFLLIASSLFAYLCK